MEETGTGLWRQFPLLLPQNRARTVYEGFVTAQVLARRRSLPRRTPVPRRGAARRRPVEPASGGGREP